MEERTESLLVRRQFRPKRGPAMLICVIAGILVLTTLIAVPVVLCDQMKDKTTEKPSSAQIRNSPTSEASSQKEASGQYCLLSRSDNRVFTEEEAAQAVEQVKSCGGKDVQPVLLASVLYQYQEGFFFPRILAAFDPDADASAFGLKHMVKEGEYSLERCEIGIGQVLADEFRLKVGDKVVLHSPRRLSKLFERDDSGKYNISRKSEYYLPTECTVSFIFSSGEQDFDRDIIFISLDDADDLFKLDFGCATHICVQPDPTLHLDDFKDRILQNDSQKGLRFVSEMPTKEEDLIKQDLIIIAPAYAFLQRLIRVKAEGRPATQN